MSKGIVSIDDLAKLLGLQEFNDLYEYNIVNIDDSGKYYADSEREEAERWDDEPFSDEDYEEALMKGQEVAGDELYHKWYDGVHNAAEYLLGQHGLVLVPTGNEGTPDRPYNFKITPEKSWKDSANYIRETINGVGDFHFYTLKEFLDYGPYTAREAVLSHLSYISDYPKVYGDHSAKTLYERSFR